MSTPSDEQFQLFPLTHFHTVPGCRGTCQGTRRHHRPSIRSPSMSTVLEDVKSPGQTEAVILQIIEDTNTIMPPPPPRHPPTNSTAPISQKDDAFDFTQTPRTRISPLASSIPPPSRTQSPAQSQAKFVVFPPPAAVSIFNQSSNRTKTPKTSKSSLDSGTWSTISRAETEATSIDQNVEQGSPTPKGSSSPMKSIFPRYNPNLPLNQQQYYCSRAASPFRTPSQGPHTRYNSDTVSSTNSAREFSFPYNGITVTSVDALEKLWEATCGESNGSDIDIFHMRLQRVDSLTYTVGTSSVPFYSLKRNQMNDLELHKTHPSKPNTKAPIVTLSLGGMENSKATDISIFPKLAELLAREQSLELARQNNLSPAHAMEAEADAVLRTQAEETCLLEWRATQHQYKLHYQALNPKCDSSPVPSSSSTSAGRSSELLYAAISMPRVGIYIPATSNNSSKYADNPLVTVDLDTWVLSIHTKAILSAIPSLHGIDILIATLVTVLVTNETTQPILENMDIYVPKAEDFPDPYRVASPRPGSRDNNINRDINPNGSLRYCSATTGQTLFTTQAEREESEQEATLMARIRQDAKSNATRNRAFKWVNFSWLIRPFSWIPQKLRRTPTEVIELSSAVAVEENQQASATKKKRKCTVFGEDIERYGQDIAKESRVGDQLPQPTKTVVRVLLWVFSVIFWSLSVCVRLLMWMVLKVNRSPKNEKV
ncbi:hypothetical protein FQN57_007057 [Myotisia sp. PD_48]|nr:hypothetical protein FQN57_007057 [Myotisia sp. PD_48]